MTGNGDTNMTSWKPVEIKTDDDSEITNYEQDNLADSLSISPESLHQNFVESASHLNEVENRHKQTLVSAGMIPENHIANNNPEMALGWLIKELNGRMNPDGLTIPFNGITIDNLNIMSRDTANGVQIQVNVSEDNGEQLSREFTLPSDAKLANTRALFIDNHLYLRW